MKVVLGKEDDDLYSRLFISRRDIGFARACATCLLKKGWHHRPWERRGTIYFQQAVFTTSLVTAYGRPFTRSHGWPNFPSELMDFDADEQKLHETLLILRHQVYAHSDSAHYSIAPWRNETISTDIVGEPFLVISAEDATRFQFMADKLIAAIQGRLVQICPSF